MVVRFAAQLSGLLALAACSGLPFTQTPSLDGVLLFDDPAKCGPGADLNALIENMSTRGPDGLPRAGKIVASKLDPELVGQPRVIERVATGLNRYTIIEARVRGRWLGVPVQAVRRTIGHDNGINSFSIAFAAPEPVVRVALT